MLKKLKSLFIVEDEGNGKKQEESVKEESNATKTSSPQSTSEVSINVDLENPKDIGGQPDPKFVDILLKAIEKNNMDGFDYLEYKQALQNLNNMGMDEATQYKSAFAMAKTMGVTPVKLKNSAQHYINILKKEEQKFKEALINQRQTQIKGREENIKNLEASIKQKLAEIDKLKKEITTHQSKLDKIKAEINKSAAKVENTNNKFHLAYNIVLGQINDDVQKMNSYLK